MLKRKNIPKPNTVINFKIGRHFLFLMYENVKKIKKFAFFCKKTATRRNFCMLLNGFS